MLPFIYLFLLYLVLNCPFPTLKNKGRLSDIISILWCIVLEEKVEDPPGCPEEKDSSNKLLVLVKPPFIKPLGRASCLYVSYLEENQSEHRISLYLKMLGMGKKDVKGTF